MATKKQIHSEGKWILKNILAAAALILILVLLAQLILKVSTRHNKEITVPDFTGMSMVDAKYQARKNDIRLDVTDSVFVKRFDRGAVFSQNPKAGSKVKKGRRIMITINATQAKTTEMPNLVGYSLRQAMTEIKAKGLVVGTLTYREDIATNNVLAQSCGGKEVAPRTELEAESVIDLTLGRDPANSFTYVPHLIGFTSEVATETILDNSLNVGKVTYDDTVKNWEDSLNAVVYRQTPAPSSSSPYLMGASVNIDLTTNQAKLAAPAAPAAVPDDKND